MMGCGKSTIGKMLAEEIGYNFVDCDEYLENKYNKTIPECFEISEKYFRDLESECVKELSLQSGNVLSTGGGIVLRAENIEVFKDDVVIFINRPIENILSDVDKSNRPLINNQDSSKVLEIYNSRIELYKSSCDFEIVNDGSIEAVLNEIKKIIK